VLGILSGISAAVILGALMIHGLQPGESLFTKSPHVIYTVMWGFILANIMMGGTPPSWAAHWPMRPWRRAGCWRPGNHDFLRRGHLYRQR